MNRQIFVGAALVASHPIIDTTASAVGIAKTGTAIGTLTGAAHTSATAAWVGLGSMKAGMFIMGVLPIIGWLLVLDGISGKEPGSPIINWYEESWRRYEAQCEMEELKAEVNLDLDHQLRAIRIPLTLAQQEDQFRALEVEHDLYLLKKEIGIQSLRQSQQGSRLSQRTLMPLNYSDFKALHTPNEGLRVRIHSTGVIGTVVSEFLHNRSNIHTLEIKPDNTSYVVFAAFSDVGLDPSMQES